MFTIKPNGDNRIDMTISGKIREEEMERVLDEFNELARDVENGRMLYTIDDFKFPSLGAIAVELTRLPQLFNTIRKFDRAAVLADEGWIQKISELEGALIPGLEIKAFDRADKAAAEAWLAG